MALLYTSVAFIVLSAVAVALFAYWLFKRRELRHILPVLISMAASAIIIVLLYYQSLPLSGFLVSSIAVAALSAMLPILYRKRPMAFMLAIFVLVFGAAISFDTAVTVGMFGVGTIIGMLYFDRYISKRRENRSLRKSKTEMTRDLVQMVIGLVVVALMLFFQQGYVYLIFLIIILAYLFNNLISRTGAAFNLLSKFERKDVDFGVGAVHIAAGLAILLGFADFRLALFGVFALFFADALATLSGISFYRSNKLPYNRRKTVAGTTAFFVATVIPGALLLGPLGVGLSVILTLVESIDLPMDDNVAIPVVTTVLGLLLGL